MRKRLALILVLAGSAAAAQQPAAPGPFTPEQKRQVVDQAAQALADGYIYPDRGRAAGEAIRKALADGGYDAIVQRAEFADRLTADLQAVTHDKHMRVMDPTAPPPPAGSPLGPPPRSWGGFIRAGRLKGNIGYIDLAGFPNPAMFRDAADASMTAVAGTDALIIDMRRNGGGSPEAVSYLCSFLFDEAKPVHLNDLVWRNRGTETYRTQTFFTGPTPSHYLNKPVILITSPRTFSGGEEFTNDLKVLKRAIVVGETTGGGANPGGVQMLAGGLGFFVPAGRAENPVTKTSWEGVGVQPDVAADPASAFATAYRTALKAAPSSADRKRLLAAAINGEADAWIDAMLVTPRTTASPAAEAALRKVIDRIGKGEEPDYALLDPGLVLAVKQQLPNVRRDMANLGALQSLTFKQVDGLGSDVYHATFEHGQMDWVVYVTADGHIANVFYPRPPQPS